MLQAYVIFVQNMGGSWLERNLTTFLSHVLDLVANPKAASSHVDAVYSRYDDIPTPITAYLKQSLPPPLSVCAFPIKLHRFSCGFHDLIHY